MAPVRFDDIPRIAREVLSDEGMVHAHFLRAKQKTNWRTSLGRLELVSQLDFFGKGKGAAPAKLVWRFPAPFGLEHFKMEKLEVDRGGKFKLDASSGNLSTSFKLDCKNHFTEVSKVAVDHTYTGFEDAQMKLELKLAKSPDFMGELTYNAGMATLGMKFTSAALFGSTPDLGMRLFSGPFFCSLLAREHLREFTMHGFCRVTSDIRCAAMYQYGGKANGNFALAVSYQGLYKVKVAQDKSIYCSVRHSPAKGFMVLSGLKYDCHNGDCFWGVQLCME